MNLKKALRLTSRPGRGKILSSNSSQWIGEPTSWGEFSLTDKRLSKIDTFMANTLFDENYGGKNGNCHVALGASYADTYDGNLQELTKEKKKDLGFNDSALHWDLVNTEKKRVSAHLVSGKKLTIYENGKFTM